MRFKSLVFFCAISLLSNAQNVAEYRTWTKVSVGSKIKSERGFKFLDGCKLDVSGMYRTNSGKGFDRFIMASELSKKTSKNLKYAIELREYLIFDDAGSNTGLRHRQRLRLTIERRYKTPVGDFFMRYGLQHREVITGPGSRRTDFRVRASYAYNIKNFKWDPQFNVEYIGVAGGNFDKSIRAGISTDHKLLSGKIKIGYFYEHNPQLLDSDCYTVSIGFKF